MFFQALEHFHYMNSSAEYGTTFPPKFTMSSPKGSYSMGTITSVSNKMERVSNLF